MKEIVKILLLHLVISLSKIYWVTSFIETGTFFDLKQEIKRKDMFRAVKNPFVIEVSFDGENVHVKPIKKSSEGIIYRTIARCEEFLAQLFIKEQKPVNKISGLAKYFKQRGWSISY